MYYTKSDVAGCNVRHLHMDTSIIIIIETVKQYTTTDSYV